MDVSFLLKLSNVELELLAQDIYALLNDRKRDEARDLGYELEHWSRVDVTEHEYLGAAFIAKTPYGRLCLEDGDMTLDGMTLDVCPEDEGDITEVLMAPYEGEAIKLIASWAEDNRTLLEESMVKRTQEE